MLNNVVLIGRMTRDVEYNKTQSGTSIAKFNLAVNRKFAKDGQQDADFFNITAWGKTADFLQQYNIGTGRLVAVEGEVRIDQVQGEDGRNKYFTNINANTVQVLDKSEQNDGMVQEVRHEGPELDISADELPF